MWSTVTGCPLYRAAMSKCRFEFLIACMRFDNPDTYAERQQQDKFANMRELWDSFISNCGRLYVPHVNLIVDEQLLGFRGNCPFRMYIPNKAAKYGIKLVLICESETKYMLSGIPCLGKQETTSRSGVNLEHYYTNELTRPYHGSNRYMTTDNRFTSVRLISDLLTNYGMTLVGTVRGNKREIPLEMKAKGAVHKWRHTILGKIHPLHPLVTFRHKYLNPFKYNVTICKKKTLRLQLHISIYFVSA